MEEKSGDLSSAKEINNHTNYNEEELLAGFVGGGKSDFYLGKWKSGKMRSWNWPAALFPPFWLGYRKMYKTVFLLFGAFLLIDVIVAFLGFDSLRIDSSLGIAMGVAFGISGNLLYKNYAQSEIKRILDSNKHGNVMDRIKQRGGTSQKGIWIVIAVVISYAIISTILTEYIIDREEIVAITPISDVEGVQSEETIKQSILDLIALNFQALEEEDLEMYMTMIYMDDANEIYEETRNLVEMLFTEYDLEYEWYDPKFIFIKQDEVILSLRQISRVVEGSAYRDNETTIVHTFKFDNGVWKFAESEVESVIYLDEVALDINVERRNDQFYINGITLGMEDDIVSILGDPDDEGYNTDTWYLDGNVTMTAYYDGERDFLLDAIHVDFLDEMIVEQLINMLGPNFTRTQDGVEFATSDQVIGIYKHEGGFEVFLRSALVYVEETELTEEFIPSLNIDLDGFSHLFVQSYNETLAALSNENTIDELDFTVLQDGYFFTKLYKGIQLIGTLNPNKEIRWIGVRSENGKSSGDMEESFVEVEIGMAANIALITALGDEDVQEEIFQNIVHQQYNQFKEIGEYSTGIVRYIDSDSEYYSILHAESVDDSVDLGDYY
ncbi:DUF2628 domain-containing protein [Sporosarcina thermotolerans]|uniref:DUF2628 domain-containing protein n=1 Tax=Sporosarcina thermotolerans TaxID=633404 RepID=UPI0036D2EEBE